MSIGLALDLILVAIVLLSAWRGYRAGFITSVVGLVAILVAIYGANLLANTYSSQFTGMVEPFASGLVDSIETRILDFTPADGEEAPDFVPEMQLDEAERKNVGKVCESILLQLGFNEEIAKGLADQVSAVTDAVGTQMNVTLTRVLSERLCFIVLFAIAFCLIMILFTAIGNILDLVFGLPGLEWVNHILGCALGAGRGLILVIVIACVFRYLGIIGIALGQNYVEDTHILKSLMESNMLATILGI
ncbi:MAG: CvpA family protein [bacterium]